MADYRNRPPVDAPRSSTLDVILSAFGPEGAMIALVVIALAVGAYLVAVAAGKAW